jgi:hypothetical protein
MIDSLGGLCLMGGLALSGYMHPYLAVGLLLAFLLLSIQSYLATYTMGEFQLSFWSFGPTELRILLVVTQAGSMARAAKELAISQPAVSRAIADMEHTLGVPLFDRSSRGIEPSRAASGCVPSSA